MLVLFTDFGWRGPYLGQMKAVLLRQAPGVAIVDLMHDAPVWRPDAAGLLLEALLSHMPRRCVVLGVVDPGVGTARRALVARAGERWLVGPDNGLFAPLLSAPVARAWTLPVAADASASFHGRDVFAPAAAALAVGRMPAGVTSLPTWAGRDFSPERERILYADAFGNLMTGVRGDDAGDIAGVMVDRQWFPRARTFADVAQGERLCYENSSGLIELAVNQGRADALPGCTVGAPVRLTSNQ